MSRLRHIPGVRSVGLIPAGFERASTATGGFAEFEKLRRTIIRHSPLVGDFLDLILREQFRLFAPRLTKAIWEDYLSGCRARDPEMPKIHNELAGFSPYWTWPSTS